MFDLTLIWGIIIAIGIIMYVILDGFDIGVGILFPFFKEEEERSIMMNSIAPFWDGNETWLVLGGVALLTAFPLAYAIILPALYIPIMLFIFALIFRGVSFEFRFKATNSRYIWDRVFTISSTLMAFNQGIVLGNFVEGFDIVDMQYIGGPFDWISPFSLMTGVALVCGYALLGSTWMIMKTSGYTQQKARELSYPLGFAVLAFIGVVSLWTPLTQPEISERWFAMPRFLYLSPVPIITTALAVIFFWSLNKRKEFLPFITSILFFVMSYIGLAISIWPYVIPRHVTLWQAASHPDTQAFSLIGVIILLPAVFYYTYNSYKVFAGKVKDGDKLY